MMGARILIGEVCPRALALNQDVATKTLLITYVMRCVMRYITLQLHFRSLHYVEVGRKEMQDVLHKSHFQYISVSKRKIEA